MRTGAFRRSLWPSVVRHLSSSAASLPEGLREITSVPRTPSWSLKELHQDGAHFDAADTVLTEEKTYVPYAADWNPKLRELAELCHLHVEDEKLPSLLKDVESIIQCTKTIQAMTLNENIDDVYAKSDFDAGVVAPLRDDVVTEGDCVEKVLVNAAEKSGYYFKVPKVLQD
ncbi:Aspartyl/glutamyl-tRNA(Asn/Gln) amidotransferase subunit C [Phytophthora citrophthora]|uniref:Aspartyl/glutamyl-tRNA(Asn/Gln) amidotransferase subunit C n=1 Tax=Phytophthora citrophthora TaxID=4793 RepID=A0AAD9LQV4_9STRA|nr:Aspartyl/glutamyl-tRNA(Asn/Gln) amidotransferase subunit C [Phytophthora citrophthora]